MTDTELSCTSCGMAPLLPDEEASRLCDECSAYQVVHGVLPDRAWVQERLRRAHGTSFPRSAPEAPPRMSDREQERPTPRQLAEIRAKVAEWEQLVSERPQQFVHNKTTLAVVYLLAEVDHLAAHLGAVRGERERDRSTMSDTLGSLHVINALAHQIERFHGAPNLDVADHAKRIQAERLKAHFRIVNALDLSLLNPSPPTPPA